MWPAGPGTKAHFRLEAPGQDVEEGDVGHKGRWSKLLLSVPAACRCCELSRAVCTYLTMNRSHCRVSCRGPSVKIEVHGSDDIAIEARQLQWAFRNRLAVDAVVVLHALPASQHWLVLLRSFEFARVHRVIVQDQLAEEKLERVFRAAPLSAIDVTLAGRLEPETVKYLCEVGLLATTLTGRLWVKQRWFGSTAWDGFPAVSLSGLVVILPTVPNKPWLDSLECFLQRTFGQRLDTIETVTEKTDGGETVYVILRPARDSTLPIALQGPENGSSGSCRAVHLDVASAIGVLRGWLEEG